MCGMQNLWGMCGIFGMWGMQGLYEMWRMWKISLETRATGISGLGSFELLAPSSPRLSFTINRSCLR